MNPAPSRSPHGPPRSLAHRSRRALLILILLLSLPSRAAAADALDDALALEGLTRADLGWRPRGWWSRFPAGIPHELRHFPDLMAEPLATVTFARTAANAARDLLSAEALGKRPVAADGALYRAVETLGVDRRFGGFRSYSANLDDGAVDLVTALLSLHQAAGRQTTSITFGHKSDGLREDLASRLAAVPEAVRPALARLLLDLVGAETWVERAFRRVPLATRVAVQRRLDLGAELADAQEYFPEMDDLAHDLDEASLWYGGLKVVAALERARHDLASLAPAAGAFAVDLPTPLGWIRLRGTAADAIDGDDSFLVVDLGGDDVHRGGAAAPAPGRFVSALLDIEGDDRYQAEDGPAQGAGLGGVGVLLDVEGNDDYQAGRCAQGFGQAGLGVLADLGGNDRYQARLQAQGSAFLGIGLLLEAAGSDEYRIHGDGQGFGAVGGVGTLADRRGDDRYLAERDPKVTGRPSSHSQDRISISGVQGAGMGRRGDGSDGHSWAGGLGQLLDIEGDDSYVAGDWSMGTGYWFGTGILYDGTGDDVYQSVWWGQGAGAHFAIGAVIDEDGDDRHLVEQQGLNSLAFGHDFTVALLVEGGGKDLYDNPKGDIAVGINRSVVLLLDLAGDDVYRGNDQTRCGATVLSPTMHDRSSSYSYFADSTSLALFLDVGGKDRYPTSIGGNDRHWLEPRGSKNRAVRNFAIGVDVARGKVHLAPIPERSPAGRPEPGPGSKDDPDAAP